MLVRILEDPYSAESALECVNVVPFGFLNEINFKHQLDGSSSDLVKAGRLSQSLGGITIFASVSDNLGIKKLSAFVFCGAKLISICDMNDGGEKYSASFGYNILDFGKEKFGVIVGADVFCPDAVKALSMCGCVSIIDLYEDFYEKKAKNAAEFYSFVYGIDFIAAGKTKSYYYNSSGTGIEIENGKPFSSYGKKVFKEIKQKRSGALFYRE